MQTTRYALGLDFGTNSVRALILNLVTGEETASSTANYPSGEEGVLTLASDHHLARQNPRGYTEALEKVVPEVIEQARDDKGFSPEPTPVIILLALFHLSGQRSSACLKEFLYRSAL